ncbi:MAG: type II toxin-antitoxin system HicB family antitoxin [Methylobacter sp.]
MIEEGPTSFGAYVPDLPGCIAVGESSQEALQLIQEAIEFHIEGLQEEGRRISMPHSSSSFLSLKPNKTLNQPRAGRLFRPSA